MRLSDSGLDDLLNELQYLADRDGRRSARFVRRVIIGGCRGMKAIGLLAVRHYPWRSEQSASYEPFNITPEEMAREWRQR